MIIDNPYLRYIDQNAFNKNTQVENLNLKSNQLTFLSENLLDWNSLRSLDLSDNMWDCDCNLAWLQNTIKNLVNSSQARVKIVRCFSPLLGTDIVDVEIRGCEGEDTNQETITTELDGAMLVIVATIICSTVVITLIMISAIVCICMKCRNTQDSESYNTSQYTEETEEYCYTIPTQQEEDYVLLPSQYTLQYHSALNNKNIQDDISDRTLDSRNMRMLL